MVKTIKLTQGQVALVDDEDYDYLNQHKWCAHYAPNIKNYYGERRSKKTENKQQGTIKMHRFIVEHILNRELKSNEIIDHINHNTLDNTRNNLRIVSARQNAQNRKNKGISNYPGVVWVDQCKKWKARFTLNNKEIHLGHFDNEKDAAKAYEKACRKIGEELICKRNNVFNPNCGLINSKNENGE